MGHHVLKWFLRGHFKPPLNATIEVVFEVIFHQALVVPSQLWANIFCTEIYIGINMYLKQMPIIKSPLIYDPNMSVSKICIGSLLIRPLWDHSFKTSALFRGGGVKNLPNLPTDSSKKLPTVGG